MQTRSPLPAERAALMELIAPQTGSPFRPEELSCAVELLEAVLAPPEGNTYEARVLYDADDRPVVYACFGRTPMTDATYDLYWLVTDASRRGQGYGQQLMTALEGELQSRGARTIRVETSSLEGQGGALRFYARVGYKEVGRIPDFYRPADDLVTLTKRLA
jgi:ribosomal protein S18 acetylase RimI-like enzyme